MEHDVILTLRNIERTVTTFKNGTSKVVDWTVKNRIILEATLFLMLLVIIFFLSKTQPSFEFFREILDYTAQFKWTDIFSVVAVLIASYNLHKMIRSENKLKTKSDAETANAISNLFLHYEKVMSHYGAAISYLESTINKKIEDTSQHLTRKAFFNLYYGSKKSARYLREIGYFFELYGNLVQCELIDFDMYYYILTFPDELWQKSYLLRIYERKTLMIHDFWVNFEFLSKKYAKKRVEVRAGLKNGDGIGNTSLVNIPFNSSFGNFYNEENKITVKLYFKLEYENPTGSMKDRGAYAMIKDAEITRGLKKGDTIIESSSGNMATALARVCKMRGYKFIAVVDKRIEKNKAQDIKKWGGKLIKVPFCKFYAGLPATVLRNDLARKYASIHKHTHFLCQLTNKANFEACTKIGAEIAEHLDTDASAIFGSIGSGASLWGVWKHFEKDKTKSLPAICAVEPDGSVIMRFDTAKKYLQTGSGMSAHSLKYELVNNLKKHIDENSGKGCEATSVSDTKAFATARFFKEIGVEMGGAAGAAVYSAMEHIKDKAWLKKLCETSQNNASVSIVVIISDTGGKYKDTIFNSNWIEDNNCADANFETYQELNDFFGDGLLE